MIQDIEKADNFTAGVGRQYIGEIGKLDNGIVAVTTHLYDGKKNLTSGCRNLSASQFLPSGKKDPSFKKKPEIALELIDRSLKRGYRPGIVLMDAGYGNNYKFFKGTRISPTEVSRSRRQKSENLAESIGRKLAEDSP